MLHSTTRMHHAIDLSGRARRTRRSAAAAAAVSAALFVVGPAAGPGRPGSSSPSQIVLVLWYLPAARGVAPTGYSRFCRALSLALLQQLAVGPMLWSLERLLDTCFPGCC